MASSAQSVSGYSEVSSRSSATSAGIHITEELKRLKVDKMAVRSLKSDDKGAILLICWLTIFQGQCNKS
jgi:hypothetical protein